MKNFVKSEKSFLRVVNLDSVRSLKTKQAMSVTEQR